MVDLTGWAQFGLGAAIIGGFFVPFVYRLLATIKEKDIEIKALQDSRVADLKEILAPVIEVMRQQKESNDALLVFFDKLKATIGKRDER